MAKPIKDTPILEGADAARFNAAAAKAATRTIDREKIASIKAAMKKISFADQANLPANTPTNTAR